MNRSIKSAIIAFFSAALMYGSGCQDDSGTVTTEPAPNTSMPWFQDVAAKSGIDFSWESGASGDYNLPEIIGGGVAMIDYDNDGDLDLYFIQGGNVVIAQNDPASNGTWNRLYRNDGDMTFTDVTEGSGAGDRGYGMSVATGDYDNDGDIDLYITNVGRNTLLRNDNGLFTDITETANVGDTGWGTAAAFLDFDIDGDLDLYVANYLRWSPENEITCYASQGGEEYCAPMNYPTPAGDVLYRNEGDGTFENVSIQSGIGSTPRTGLGVAVGDYDQDGHLDIFIANDGMSDLLWRNQGDGTFEDIGLTWGCAMDNDGKEKAGMGVGSRDFDHDGDLDLIVCNLTGESDSMFRNEGRYFIDTTAQAGVKTVTSPHTRFGLGWVDFNNDGWLDLYEATGRVQRSTKSSGSESDPYAEEDVLMKGTSNGRYAQIQPRGGTTDSIVRTSRAAAFGDLDNDGWVDTVVVNKDAPANIYHNILSGESNWIQLRILDEHGRDALGASVSAKAGLQQVHVPVQTAYSYFAANDPRIHLGLGQASSIDDVVVTWTDGSRESFPSMAAGQTHTITRGTGQPAKPRS